MLDPKNRIDATEAVGVSTQRRLECRQLAARACRQPLPQYAAGPCAFNCMAGLRASNHACNAMQRAVPLLTSTRPLLGQAYGCPTSSRLAAPCPSLQHRWFFTDPQPCRPDQLPRFDESHEMNMKKRRHELQQQQQGRQQRQRTDGGS